MQGRQEPLPSQPGTQGPPPTSGMQSGMGTPGGQQQGMAPQPGMGGQQMGRPGVAGRLLESVNIDDIIQTDVVTAQTDTPVPELSSKMAQEDVGSVVVVEDDQPVGIVTDRMIALELESEGNLSDKKVEDVVSEGLETGTSTLTVFEVLNRMSSENIRRFPIVNEDGELQGIITLDDILVLLGTELERATEIIQTQSPRL